MNATKTFEYSPESHTLRLGESTHEGVSAVWLSEQTFYVSLKPSAVEQIGLLGGVAESPEEVQEMVRFLTFLRRITPILMVGEEGEETTDATAIKRAWFAALREVDKTFAAALEDRLKDGGADKYLTR